jgi:hypothetical protein
MVDSGACRLCGGPLPPRRSGPGRPRTKCDACRDLRRPADFVYIAWRAAAYLAGARHPKDSLPQSKELRRGSDLFGRSRENAWAFGLSQ